MPSGLNIQDGLYIEEPVRRRVGLPVVPNGGVIFDGKNVWRKQNRQTSAYVAHEATRGRGAGYAKFKCTWCGSTQTIQLNRAIPSHCCPNCGGPR